MNDRTSTLDSKNGTSPLQGNTEVTSSTDNPDKWVTQLISEEQQGGNNFQVNNHEELGNLEQHSK